MSVEAGQHPEDFYTEWQMEIPEEVVRVHRLPSPRLGTLGKKFDFFNGVHKTEPGQSSEGPPKAA